MTDLEMKEQFTFEWSHKPSFAIADFIVTDANALAFDYINNWANWPGALTLLSGPAKSGKTHLAHIWAEFCGAAFVTADMVEDLASGGGAMPVVLENVDRFAYEEGALFHFLNQSMRDNRQVLMTARADISTWPFITDDVKSRARLAAHFSVLAADELALCQMFAKLFDDRQIVVDPNTITYLVARMERSPDEVFTLAGILDKLALKQGRAISLKIAAEALGIRAAHFGALDNNNNK